MNFHLNNFQPEGFLNFLEAENVLDKNELGRLRAASSQTTHSIDEIATELGLMRDQEVGKFLAKYIGSDFHQKAEEIDFTLEFEKMDIDFLIENSILPVSLDDEFVRVVVANPFARTELDALAFLYEKPVFLIISSRSSILERIEGLRSQQANLIDETEVLTEVAGPLSADLERLKDSAREAPIVQFVSSTISKAVEQKATDIHIEPGGTQLQVRYRVDGLLQIANSAPLMQAAGITTRIKILANLNISERRRPQDGRLRLSVRGQEVDFRVSIVPSIHGETIVLRILDRSNVVLDLKALGYDNDTITSMNRLASRPNGIVLVTGPTGSGKTTTLCSMLSNINDPEIKIFTVEDPVEYRLDGAVQVQVDPTLDVTFAQAFRAALRQDPDVVLVGEIRDTETAKIAIQASLAGRLVFSTLHTNSAAGAVTRLRDMGIEDYLLGATLRGVIGQRLLRRLCAACHGKGCDECGGRGYQGRTVTYEVAEVTQEISQLISAGRDEYEIEASFETSGMISMDKRTRILIEHGLTDVRELARVLELEVT